jgi:glycosyltransferase involved in cell wall biosynthesis
MTDDPTISVVIPTHNRRAACERAVTSALSQEPPPREVIVCDDGSDDGTQSAVEAIQSANPRLRYFRLEPGQGTPGPARNVAIKNATGDWIAFLDDDDRWLEGKLAAQVTFLTHHPCDVVGSDAIRSDGTRYFGPRGGVTLPSASQLEATNPLILSSVLARRDTILVAGGFDEDRFSRSVADYSLWLRMADVGARFGVINAPLISYDDHPNDRLSDAWLQTQLALTALRWRRLTQKTSDYTRLKAALYETYNCGSAAFALGAKHLLRRGEEVDVAGSRGRRSGL